MLKAFGMAPPVLALVLLLGSGVATAAPNKCGCTRNESNNSCSCSKSAKCGCPGDCEPKGCEEKREAQMKKEIDADRKHKASTAGETRTVSAKVDKGDNGDNGKPEPAAPKLSPAQTKQLAKLLDSYLKAHPESRVKNAEELRNELSLKPQ